MKIGKIQFEWPKFRFKPKRPSLPKIPSSISARKFSFRAEDILRSHIFYNALATIICSYFMASFFAKAMLPFLPAPMGNKPHAPVKAVTMNQFDSIYSRNLFNEKGLIPDVDSSKFGDAPVKTSLPLNLMGVIVVEDSLKSVASVEDRGSNQVIAVRVNEAIVPNTLVQKIETNKLIFLNKSTGRREFIDLPEDGPMPTIRSTKEASTGNGIQQLSPGRYQIDRKLVDKTLSNLGVALTQARCVPNFEAGKPAGYRCGEIVPGSIYDQLGMKNDDVICGINGQSINDPGKAFEIFGQLKSMNNIEICINRHGSISNMNYDIN